MSISDDAKRKGSAAATDQPATKKRKSDQFKGEFWSLDGDDDIDPFSDLVVVVKSESNNEEEEKAAIHASFHVHRSKLGRNSGFFDRLLRGGFAESNNSDHVDLFLHPSVASHFDTVLDFMYGEWEPKELDHSSVAVAIIADYLEIPDIYDKIMDQMKELENMSLMNEYMGYAKVLGMTDLKTQLVKCCISLNPFIALLYLPYDRLCLSIDLMEACLDYFSDDSNTEEISNLSIANCNGFAGLVNIFLFCTDVESIPKNIYDRIVDLPGNIWVVPKVTDAYGLELWEINQTKLLILQEKIYPSLSATVPLTSVEKRCVDIIVKQLSNMDRTKKMKALEGLSKRILSVISCVASGTNVEDF